jgi:hypothetical protein
MIVKRHGLSIGIERMNQHFFMTMTAVGQLTHEDYQMITPMIDAALSGVPDAKIKMLIDGTKMEGWQARAAWDDFKLGLKHGKEFEKVAIYGNKNWQQIAAKMGQWFISGEIQYFNQCDDALQWLDVNN